MAHQDDLFELIRSLSPSEKRYFKLHAEKFSNGGYKRQYEKLFDALNLWSDEAYDEKEFKKRHKGKSFIKNLPSDKNYLRELVLKVIRNYGSDADPETELPEMLLSIRLLINKGLKSQVNKLIEKAMRLAEEREQYNEMLVIYDLLLKFYRMSPGEAPYNAKQIEQMDDDILHKIMLTRQALYLRTHMAEIHGRAQWRIREAEAKEIMDKATTLAANTKLPKRAELSLLNVRQFYLIHHHRYQESLDITAEWLDKIERSPRPFVYSTDQYRITLSNYLHCAVGNDTFDLLPSAIDKIKSLKTNNDKEAAENFRISALYELLYLMNKTQLDGVEQIGNIEGGLRKYKRFITEAQCVYFRFNIALFFFLRRKHTDSLKQINELYYICGRDESYFYSTTMARVMEWMCQYSLGEYSILDAALRNLKRYFTDRKMKNDCFDIMFELFHVKLKEVNSRQASNNLIKTRFEECKPPQDWEQMKEIVLTWI